MDTPQHILTRIEFRVNHRSCSWATAGFMIGYHLVNMKRLAETIPFRSWGGVGGFTFSDFIWIDGRYYLEAARGNFDIAQQWFPNLYASALDMGTKIGWLYNDTLALLWWPFAQFDYGIVLWVVVCYVAVGFIVVQLFKQPYGWLYVLATFPAWEPNLFAANVTVVLAALLCAGASGLAAPAIKLPVAPLAVVLAIRRDNYLRVLYTDIRSGQYNILAGLRWGFGFTERPMVCRSGWHGAWDHPPAPPK